MPPTRQDAWSLEEDSLLAQVVLKHIREGSTQLQAFEEVGIRLSRSATACGFRWNSSIRKQYETEIKTAKNQRKEFRKEPPAIPATFNQASLIEEKEKAIISFETVIHFLNELYKKAERSTNLEDSIEKIKELEMTVHDLTANNEQLEINLKTIQKDYHNLLAIMERARKMVILQD
jgi:RsfA family transcription factor